MNKLDQFNYFTGHKYQGINAQDLKKAQVEHEYKSNQWAKYNQWLDKDLQVQKGEHGVSIMIFVPNEDEPSKPKIGWHRVFNYDQVAPVTEEQA